MLGIGNGRIPHFQEAAGNHFQPICWKSFPTYLLEMEEVQGSRHVQISNAISTKHDGRAGWLDVADASLARGRTSNEVPAVVFHSVMFNPSSTLRA
jgi:hypothetical protein